MEHYQLSDVKSLVVDPFAHFPLDKNVVRMKVQPQSKMQNLLGFAMNKMKNEDTLQILWTGDGQCSQKALNCADIMKRKVKNLYMLSRKSYKRTEEYWDPIYIQGLDRLKVNRDVDTVSILLSKLPLDEYRHEPGYYDVDTLPSHENAASNDQRVKKKPRQRQRKVQQSKPATAPTDTLHVS